MVESYDPCPCGSGKKYKFCCKQRKNERERAARGPALRVLSNEDILMREAVDDELLSALEEGQRLNARGLRLMEQGNAKDAMPWFEKAHQAAPFFHSAANNLAISLFATGNLEEAIRIQRDITDDRLMPNPFGWANLSVFYLVAGQEKASRAALEKALELEMPSADACAKVCEALARFERHQDILNLTDDNCFDVDPSVCFYAGVAAANLGMKEKAIACLRRVHIGYHKADTAQRYLEWLKSDTAPYTIRGNWPYHMPYEICTFETLETQFRKDADTWQAQRIVVRVAEALLNDSLDDPGQSLSLLGEAKHPDAVPLLWAIVKGTVGPDSLRMQALNLLQERGEIERDTRITMFIDGAQKDICFRGTQLNPEYRFGPELSPALHNQFETALRNISEQRGTWKERGAEFKRIAEAAPDFYPARFNYAVSLLHRGKLDEAEPILQDIVEAHPAYLFATASLVQLYLQTGRREKADDLIQTTELPEETHPTAMAQWMVAQTLVHMDRAELEKARRCIASAHDIAPDSPVVQSLYRQLQIADG